MRPFAVMQIIAAANARRAAGHPVLNLCMGEPPTGAPATVRAAAARLVAAETLGYTEALGAPVLREALAGHYRRWYDLEVPAGAVAVTTGSSGGFVLAFVAAFDPGDRVVLVRPGYPAYRNTLQALGCEVVELACGPGQGFVPTVADLERLDGPVQGLVLAGPANPTGTVLGVHGFDAVAAWCARHGVRLVSDEIYHGITYGPGAGLGPGAPTAARHRADGAVVVSSFSKFWAMTGWRLGWMVLPDDLVGPVDALAGNLALCPPAPAQFAAVAAFDDDAYAEAAAGVARYAQAREVALGRLDALGWARAAPAQGAFYVYADVQGWGLPSPELCSRLLHEAGVALTPGTDFDPVHGHDWVRLSFAAGADDVGRALDAVQGWGRRHALVPSA